MKAITSLALFAVVSVTAMAKPLDGWSTDLTAAMQQAKDSGRQVLVERPRERPGLPPPLTPQSHRLVKVLGWTMREGVAEQLAALG